jgi:hypothetical protein
VLHRPVEITAFVGSLTRLVSIKKQRVCSPSQPTIVSELLFQSKLFAAILQSLK